VSNVSLKVALQGIPGALDAWLEVHSEEEVRAEILALVSPMETMRDKFALGALASLIAEPVAPGDRGTVWMVNGKSFDESPFDALQDFYASAAYKFADAMLAAREVTP
jgi:hypothetical protein